MLSLALSLALGQAAPSIERPARKPAPPVAKDSKPVTVREASVAFRRVSGVLSRALEVPVSPTLPADAERPFGRGEFLVAAASIVSAVEGKFRVTPPPVRTTPKRWTVGAGDRKVLEGLVRGGFVADIGPVATGTKPTLTPRQFGDALGYLLARVADRTNLPSVKWTPALQRGN